jgi:hypothetical protein
MCISPISRASVMESAFVSPRQRASCQGSVFVLFSRRGCQESAKDLSGVMRGVYCESTNS